MSAIPFVLKIPQEVTIFIFGTPVLSGVDLLQCMLVCASWYPLVKTVFYKSISFTQDSNITSFVNSLERYEIGDSVSNLSISHTSRRAYRPPFFIPYQSTLLLLNCQNIVKIKMTTMTPFYMMCALEQNSLPNLEKIDVCWETCKASPSIRKRFYGANFNHKSTIKYIDMPGYSTNEVPFYNNGVITYFTEEEYFASFDNLRQYRFQK